MNLQDIPQRSLVLIDANIFLYAARNASQQCVELARSVARGEIFGIVASHTLTEIMHRLMVAEARENGWLTRNNPTRQLAEQPEKVIKLFRYEHSLRDLLTGGIRLEPLLREDFLTSLSVQKETGLLTNDSLLIAVARRLAIQAIASADKSFRKISEIVLYSPDDLTS